MTHIVNAQGLNMPRLGLGTWPMLGQECTRAVEQALALGYRHIDTAAAYNNEDAVGQALVNSPIHASTSTSPAKSGGTNCNPMPCAIPWTAASRPCTAITSTSS